MGCQHGGGYIVQNYDKEHIDSDYNFCDYFISYGYSKQFNNKIKKKLLNLGSFKSKFYQKLKFNINKKNTSKNILFIPNEITPISSPSNEVIQNKRYEIQKNICKYLNNYNSDVFVKVLHKEDYFQFQSLFKKTIITLILNMALFTKP